MKINIREINYKEVEIPDSYKKEDIESAISNRDYIICDTTISEYSYEKFNSITQEYDGNWINLFDY